MRISKERAKLIQTRPEWLVKDRDWSIFKDYRDSKQSADDLAVLWSLSRAQVQNVIRNIIQRWGRPGEISARATNVLRRCGLTMEPEKLLQELQELNVRAQNSEPGNLSEYLRLFPTGCGTRTRQEIIKLYEDLVPNYRLRLPDPCSRSNDASVPDAERQVTGDGRVHQE